MKCAICKRPIETTFLNKVVGTYVKDDAGKKKVICPMCQKMHKAKDEQIKQLK